MKKKIGIKTKMMLLTIMPVIVITAAVSLLSINKMRESMISLSEDRLAGIAKAISEAYDVLCPGDWSFNDQELKKGDQVLSGHHELIDGIWEKDGVHCTVFYGDTRIMTSLKDEAGQRIIGTKASEEVIQKVLREKKEYFAEDTIIQGKKYFSFYKPLFQKDGSVAGMLFTGIAQDEVQTMIQHTIIKVVTAAIIFMMVDIVIILLFSNMFLNSIRNCAKTVAELKNGNLEATAKSSRLNKNDELGTLAEDITELARKLQDIISQMKKDSLLLDNNASRLKEISKQSEESINEVGQAIDEVAKGATEQAEDTQSSASKMETLGNCVCLTLEQIEILSESAQKTQDAKNNAVSTMQELEKANQKTKKSVDLIVKQSEENMEAAKNIQNIVKVIKDIASQTNLLSLNASIEASHAGDRGKGFAVVASEVGKLAGESKEAAGQIEKIVTDLYQKITETSKLTSGLKQNTEKQLLQLAETQESFIKMGDGINNMHANTEKIQQEILHMEKIKEEVSNLIESLSAISQQNAASSEETTASADVIQQSISELRNMSEIVTDISSNLLKTVSGFAG